VRFIYSNKKYFKYLKKKTGLKFSNSYYFFIFKAKHNNKNILVQIESNKEKKNRSICVEISDFGNK